MWALRVGIGSQLPEKSSLAAHFKVTIKLTKMNIEGYMTIKNLSSYISDQGLTTLLRLFWLAIEPLHLRQVRHKKESSFIL